MKMATTFVGNTRSAYRRSIHYYVLAYQIMTDCNTQRRLLQTQTTTWYGKEKEFEGGDSKYFHRPYLERTTDPKPTTNMVCTNRTNSHDERTHTRDYT